MAIILVISIDKAAFLCYTVAIKSIIILLTGCILKFVTVLPRYENIIM